MAEEDEGLESDAGKGGNIGADAMVMTLLGASREKAEALADEHIAVLRLQRDKLERERDSFDEEQRLLLSHLRTRRFSDYSKMVMEIAIGLFLLVIVTGLGAMVFNAAHDHDVVIDAFSVPPDIAARGLTGQVVASELLDRFVSMQRATLANSKAAATSRIGTVGDNIRIGIPQTGVTVGELDSYLRRWLGSETHVSGEIVHAPAGLAITIRYASGQGEEVDGAESDFSRLMQKAAENLYKQVLPQRYADYLIGQGRFDEGLSVLKPLTEIGSPEERATALISRAELLSNRGDPASALKLAMAAARLAPDSYAAHWALADIFYSLGREQAEIEQDAIVVKHRRELEKSTDLYFRNAWRWYQAVWDWRTADYQALKNDVDGIFANGGFGNDVNNSVLYLSVHSLGGVHELSAARQAAATVSPKYLFWPANFMKMLAQSSASASAGDWQGTLRSGNQLIALAQDRSSLNQLIARSVYPRQAVALAMLGKIPQADALIAGTPLDCDACVRARARIAAIGRDWRAVDYWYGKVAARSPSIPFADAEWGAALRSKGDLDGAMAKFARAHAISPYFADPLEMWGEALMLKNRSDLALAKFEEANRYALNWGRLHLKWGEALMWSGDKPGAQRQFAIASKLDLTVPDRKELSREGNLPEH